MDGPAGPGGGGFVNARITSVSRAVRPWLVVASLVAIALVEAAGKRWLP